MGLPESAGEQRPGSGPLHQAAPVPQRVGRHPQDVLTRRMSGISAYCGSRIHMRAGGQEPTSCSEQMGFNREIGMSMTRRDFVKQATIASAAVPSMVHAQAGGAVETKQT